MGWAECRFGYMRLRALTSGGGRQLKPPPTGTESVQRSLAPGRPGPYGRSLLNDSYDRRSAMVCTI